MRRQSMLEEDWGRSDKEWVSGICSPEVRDGERPSYSGQPGQLQRWTAVPLLAVVGVPGVSQPPHVLRQVYEIPSSRRPLEFIPSYLITALRTSNQHAGQVLRCERVQNVLYRD